MRTSLSALLLIALTALAGAERPSLALRVDEVPELPLVFSLRDALDLALEHNPRLKQGEEALIQRDQSVREAKAAQRPQLDASANYTEYDEGRLQSFGGGSAPDSVYWNAGLEASVTVLSGGRNHNAVKREKSRYGASEKDQQTTREDLLAQVYETYYDAELAQQTIRVQKESIDLLTNQLTFSSNRLKAGVGERFDVLQAEVALANARPPLIRAMNDYRRQIDSLRRLLGMQYPAGKDAQDVELQPSGAPPPAELDIRAAVLRAIEGRSELARLDALIEAEHFALNVLRSERAPEVDLFGTYGSEGNQFGGGELEGWTAGLRLNWSLWNGGGTESRIRRAESLIRQLGDQKLELALRISGEVREAFYSYEEAMGILQSTEESVQQATEALRLARNRLEAGRGTQLDVLESQYQLTRAKLESSRADNRLQRALISIKRAAGIPL